MKRFNGPSLPALIFAALMPVLPAAAAVAQTGPPAAVQQRQPTPRIDADRDGGIDRKELIAERERIFARFDADGDDRLTRLEVETVRDKLRQAWMMRHWNSQTMEARRPPDLDVDRFFSRNDRNLDGTVTKQEFLAEVEDRFKRFDRDGDGRITEEEVHSPPQPAPQQR